MFFGRNRRREKPPSPPWLKWMLIGFALFAVITSMNKGAPMNKAMNQAGTELNPHRFFNLKETKEKIFPHAAPGIRARDGQIGNGALAVCGQTVKITYKKNEQNEPSSEDAANEGETLTLRLGGGKSIPALEQGIIGMREGGTRSIVAPENMTVRSVDAHSSASDGDGRKVANVQFEVKLLHVEPPLPEPEDAPFRTIVVRNSPGTFIKCGESAKIQLTLWGIDGKKLFSTHDQGRGPILFTPGKSDVFLGLERAVVGVAPGEVLALIVPPVYQKTIDGALPRLDFPFPKNQTVLADVEVLP